MTSDIDRWVGSVGKLLGMGDRKRGLGDFALDLLLVAGMVCAPVLLELGR